MDAFVVFKPNISDDIASRFNEIRDSLIDNIINIAGFNLFKSEERNIDFELRSKLQQQVGGL